VVKIFRWRYGQFGSTFSVMKRGLFVVVGLLAICSPLIAQQTVDLDQLNLCRPEMISDVDHAKLVRRLPMLAFLDGRCDPFSPELGTMGHVPVDLSVGQSSAVESKSGDSYTVTQMQRIVLHPDRSKDSSKDAELVSQAPDNWYHWGEVGFMYGHASGKFGGDEYQEYLIGGVGNDHFQLSVGASQEDYNFKVPRRFR
jgi:hypothetical protein